MKQKKKKKRGQTWARTLVYLRTQVITVQLYCWLRVNWWRLVSSDSKWQEVKTADVYRQYYYFFFLTIVILNAVAGAQPTCGFWSVQNHAIGGLFSTNATVVCPKEEGDESFVRKDHPVNVIMTRSRWGGGGGGGKSAVKTCWVSPPFYCCCCCYCCVPRTQVFHDLNLVVLQTLIRFGCIFRSPICMSLSLDSFPFTRSIG